MSQYTDIDNSRDIKDHDYQCRVSTNNMIISLIIQHSFNKYILIYIKKTKEKTLNELIKEDFYLLIESFFDFYCINRHLFIETYFQ